MEDEIGVGDRVGLEALGFRLPSGAYFLGLPLFFFVRSVPALEIDGGGAAAAEPGVTVAGAGGRGGTTVVGLTDGRKLGFC